ncbi:MAG: beta-galactosidase, partial [Clostridia bacterium]|nr:beta-galactosidase [Clostridia bacterium]
VLRGKKTTLEVIEDILPVYGTEVTINLDREVKNVYLAPQKKDITFKQTNGVLKYTIDCFECHQMVVIEY